MVKTTHRYHNSRVVLISKLLGSEGKSQVGRKECDGSQPPPTSSGDDAPTFEDFEIATDRGKEASAKETRSFYFLGIWFTVYKDLVIL